MLDVFCHVYVLLDVCLGAGGVTSGQVSEVFRKSCNFHGFFLFLYIYTLLTRAYTTFSRCLPAWNSFRCMRRPGRPPRTLPTSLARTNTSGERFFQARRRTRRRCGPPLSILVGPAGLVTCHQDPSDAPSPALAGPTAWWGLLTTLRTSASGLSHVGPTACRCGPIPRPGHTAVSFSQTLPHLPWPWHPSKRSYSSNRSSQTAPRQLLCSSPGSLVVARTELRCPSLLLASGVVCPATPRCWTFCSCPPELRCLPSRTSYHAADARTGSEKPLVLLPRAWLNFSAVRSRNAGTLSGIY